MSRRGLARFAAKRDANEKYIVDALKAQGFSVARLSGKGIPDLLVSRRTVDPFGKPCGWVRLVEIKNPKGKNQRTADQVKFDESWQGPPVIILRSVDDALRFMVLACEVER